MATILPLAETQFNDALGVPLAGGSVYFYTPSTTTPKDTYMDALQTIPNTNPVILDSAGRAIIFGSGAYRQVVYDANGNLIWDQTTSEAVVGSASFGGTSTGSANAQIVSAGTFSGADGSTINFTAGFTNTGAMTIQVGPSGSPIAVLKNGPSGPINLVAGDIAAGNIYSVSYSVALGTFQLLQSIPPVITIASQAQAQAGTDNTTVMTPLRTNQAIQALGTPLTATGDTLYADSPTTKARLPIGTARQALLVNSSATAPQWTTLPFTKAFESSPQTINAGGLYTLPHGLGVQPKLITAAILCVSAELGYSVGQELQQNVGLSTTGNLGRGLSIVPDATNLVIQFGSDGLLNIIAKSGTGSIATTTLGKWKLIVRAWA